MKKKTLNLICCFIPVKKWRRKIRQKVRRSNIASSNKIIIVDETGIEREISKEIAGLDLRIRGENNTIKIHAPYFFDKTRFILENNNVYIEIGAHSKIHNMFFFSGWNNDGKRYLILGEHFRCFGVDITMDEPNILKFGDWVRLSNKITIWASDAHVLLDKKTGLPINDVRRPLVIGNRCWIGQGVRLLKGTHLADYTVCGGGAVVSKRFDEPNTVIAGNPARVVRTGVMRPSDETAYLYRETHNLPPAEFDDEGLIETIKN